MEQPCNCSGRPRNIKAFLSIPAFVLLVCFALTRPAGAESHDVIPEDQSQPDVANDAASTERIRRQRLLELKKDITPSQQKISSPLRSVLSKITTRGITRANAHAMNVASLTNPLVRLKPDGRIQVYVHLASFGEAQLNALRSLELEIEIANEDLAIVQGWAPFDRIEGIAARSFVTRVTPPSYGRLQAGSKTTEGDAILKADLVRALGFDGSGVKVGIISDGANNWPQSQATGDLPASGITLFGNCVPRPRDISICSSGFTCNEGTAMAEIIHDLAPAAKIAVATGLTSLAFISGVNELVNTFGADIIVDDLTFFGEPYYADGAIAQAVAAVKNRVVYVSDAGNAARRHYEGNYFDSLGLFNEHDFGRAAGGFSDKTMDVLVGAGEFLFTILQWNDRFGLSANNYDLFVLNEAETSVIASSQSFQTGTQDPIEAVCVFNPTGAAGRVKVNVDRFSGASRRLEMFLLGNILIEQYGVRSGSVIGHAGVTGVVATGAIDASDPGNDTIEPFSSRGPSRIDFPNLQIREKPDVTAIDGVSVTGTGGFPSTFFGTSASAPHVAAIAALLKHSAPSATPVQIRNALTSGAVDLGPAGRDDTYGLGRVDAFAAFNIINRPKSLPWLMLLLDDD